MREAGTLPPDSTAEPDTSIKARPIFKTDAGRSVRGGGGIVPDVLVRQDTLTTSEKEFARVLGEKVALYRDVLTAYALELKKSRALSSPDFEVTPEMRRQVQTRLAARGVLVSPDVFEGASQLVSEQLAYEATRYVFGRSAEFRRRARDDRQVQEALMLLRKAPTPKDLLSLAAERTQLSKAAD
jgi:carboxyl-terminal processing protease